ncbi:MAG TPA: hypothetical protein VGF56_16215 [Rhizomicrobium sp.]|jgi:hypothetical protein
MNRAKVLWLAVCLPAFLFGHAAVADTTLPRFEDSGRCPMDKSVSNVCDLIDGLPRLEAPDGGRVYRETWSGPLMGPMGHGSIVLTVHANGTRTLQTPWHRGAFHLSPSDLPDFESDLARSGFDKLPVYSRWGEVCIDGVATALEAVVDGHYRIAYFDHCGGVHPEAIAQTLDELFVFAAGKSGLSDPVNPDHPTFRG